jgi:peptidoglycan/xylan/chitin deacetylase (PgdA/CDA1 family)
MSHPRGIHVRRLAIAVIAIAVPVCPGLAAGRTTVSLEFDHATTDQLAGIAIAGAHRMPVTVFAISGRVGDAGYMTAGQLRALQRAGNEIGGHTTDHQDLTELAPAAQRAAICDDRTALEADGLRVTDFAYPFGHFGPQTPAIVRSCGYESARGTGGLAGPEGCYGACPAAETIPPARPFDTRTDDSVLDTTPLSRIEGYVTHAERGGGGWVQIVFHHVCDRCDPYAVTAVTLAAFVTWLAARRSSGTVVRTTREVIEAPFRPAPLWALLAPGRLRLRPAQLCPATPLGARCREVGGRPAVTMRARRSGRLWLATDPAARSLELLDRGGRVVARGRRTRRAGVWTLDAGRREGAAEIAVAEPLGDAYYQVWLTVSRGAVRPQATRI